MDNKKYVFMILKIIFFTNLPAIILLPVHFKTGIGWILGSFASAVNFWFMAMHTLSLDPVYAKANVANTTKKLLLRFLFLIVWSVLVLLFVKPELVTFCLGLLAAQIAIFMYHIYYSIKNGKLGKYF